MPADQDWIKAYFHDEWMKAYFALTLKGDQRALADLISSNKPIPPYIREHLGRMLHPDTDQDIADRLVFSRSKRLARKMQTQHSRIRTGVLVLDAHAAGMTRHQAVKHVAKKLGKNLTKAPARKRPLKLGQRFVRRARKDYSSYIDHSIAIARNLPPIYQEFARINDSVFGLNRKRNPR